MKTDQSSSVKLEEASEATEQKEESAQSSIRQIEIDFELPKDTRRCKGDTCECCQ
jgi:hypothetical protein